MRSTFFDTSPSTVLKGLIMAFSLNVKMAFPSPVLQLTYSFNAKTIYIHIQLHVHRGSYSCSRTVLHTFHISHSDKLWPHNSLTHTTLSNKTYHHNTYVLRPANKWPNCLQYVCSFIKTDMRMENCSFLFL
jgi:hypothetical protein